MVSVSKVYAGVQFGSLSVKPPNNSNLQFGTRDLTGFGVENARLALCAAGCLLQYVKDTQRTALPHIRKALPWSVRKIPLS